MLFLSSSSSPFKETQPQPTTKTSDFLLNPSMALPPERSSSRTLHNFSLPTELKWGTQKHLRCIKLPATASTASTTSANGMQQLRHKLMLEYTRAVTTMADQILNNNDDHHPPPPQQPAVKDDDNNVKVDEQNDLASSRPWNLRTRRSPAPAPEVVIPTKSKRRLERDEDKDKEKERVKFSIGLKKEEIERDYLEMIGVKPPRRPKKRLRSVQKQLDTLFPGLWLTEVTPDMYEVVEHQE